MINVPAQAENKCAGQSAKHGCSACRTSLPKEFKRRVTFLKDWWPALRATCGSPKVSRFVELWKAAHSDSKVHHDGLANLPADGPFILAVNHVQGVGPVPTLLGAVLAALSQGRPSAVDEILVLAGMRNRKDAGGLVRRLARSIWGWVKQRWSKHIIEIPMAAEKQSPKLLLNWRKAASEKPSLLFPEGIARPLFGPVREGCGNWLQFMKVPVIPVAVWWQENGWHIRLGPPITWAAKTELHDLQLGFAIAEMLPEQMVDQQWRNLLQRRKQARSNLNVRTRDIVTAVATDSAA